jgi:hypothetical protein
MIVRHALQRCKVRRCDHRGCNASSFGAQTKPKVKNMSKGGCGKVQRATLEDDGCMMDEWAFVHDVEGNFWQWRSDISILVHDKEEGETPDVAVIVFGRLRPFEAAALARKIADHIEANGFPDKAFKSRPDMLLCEN